MLVILACLSIFCTTFGTPAEDIQSCSSLLTDTSGEGLKLLQANAKSSRRSSLAGVKDQETRENTANAAPKSGSSDMMKPDADDSEPRNKIASRTASHPSRGVIYSICGDNTVYWKEASDSIASIKAKGNESVTIFTLPHDMDKCKDLEQRFGIICADAIDSMRMLSPKSGRMNTTKEVILDYWSQYGKPRDADSRVLKISSMLLSPYDYSVFLDTDTHLCESMSQLFDRLGDLTKFDMLGVFNRLGALHKPSSLSVRKTNGIPKAFLEINSGVLFLHTDRIQVQDFLTEWMLEYLKDSETYTAKDTASRRGNTMADQPALLKVLWRSQLKGSIKFYGLPPQWNMKNWRRALKYVDDDDNSDWPSLIQKKASGEACCPPVKENSLPILIDHDCTSE